MTSPAITITANDLTFGIEIETHIPYGAIPVGGYHGGVDVTALPGWKVERDGSIDCPHGRQAAEFVSPVLGGAEGIREVIKAIRYITSIGGKVNASCGFHVHVGWGADDKALRRLVGNVSYYERALYAASGTKTRENGTYCRTVRESRDMVAKFKDGRDNDTSMFSRYSVLNLTNMTRRPTVEFRVFSGTLNITKAVGFISLALGLVEASLKGKRQPMWAPKDDSYGRAGTGKAELLRMFKGIGWTKGNVPAAYGIIEAEGCPTLTDMKAEMVRLSVKYDGPEDGPESV